MTRPAALALVALLAAATAADAVVLCARPKKDGTYSTSVKIREECKANENPLDPVALGLQGPKGDTGEKGEPGEPGVCTCSTTTTSTTSTSTTTLYPFWDATAVDPETGLVWELKRNADGQQNLVDPHDADNLYTWSTAGSRGIPNGTAFSVFLSRLNTPPCYAGFCDWRLPTVSDGGTTGQPAELETLIDRSRPSCGESPRPPWSDPLVDPLGNTRAYWSATPYGAPAPYDLEFAYLVNFNDGSLSYAYRIWELSVRAVRGGS